ncbi:MAG: hypothetical protein JSW64_14165 [Candidatus Zixiibacteriota bacterium]|nr:MAG: hypothetical protein JSW64_14165 [candidate division Zixibacteria bacterium]
MFPDFTLVKFLITLENYILDIWPLQIVSYILGIAAVVLAIKRTRFSNRAISFILSIYWLWIGIVFCMLYWVKTFNLALMFGIVLIVQGLLFLYTSIKENISFSYSGKLQSIIGIVLIFYAMIGYQLIGLFIGHTYPNLFAFGLVPCPTMIFTLGLLLWTDKKIPKYILIIPALFSLVGIEAAVKGIYEDIGLFVLGVLAVILIFLRDRKSF